MLDIALLVPIQSRPSIWADPPRRAALGAMQLATIRARDRFIEYLGGGAGLEGTPRSMHRSLTAVTLATSLEQAGVRWLVVDPGWWSLRAWRKRLLALRAQRPRLVALSTTFVADGTWLGTLCSLVRSLLPEARLALGGYYYATDAKQFLSLDADIYCIGEGERRIVSITEAVRDGRGLESIPGLYLRTPGEPLRYTGNVEPLPLDELQLPNWSLSTRIEPPIDPVREPIDHALETQRGCVFKCEFCTFRTLAAPMLASVERAVSAIRDVSTRNRGTISIVDATATYPRERWRRILERLVDEGGSPLPMTVYARVNDIDDEVCALMARANVRMVKIGLETADQRLLNAMRKGTRVAAAGPAVSALGRHGIKALFFAIYGFPGEDLASLSATRRLLATINDGQESAPVVYSTRISLFEHQDFAGIHWREAARGVNGRFGWEKLTITPERAAEAELLTYLELSRIPHAPYTGFGAAGFSWNAIDQTDAMYYDPAFFRWAKALDRGIGLFVEHELEGKRLDSRELARAGEVILRAVPVARGARRALGALRARAKNRLTWRLLDEWSKERRTGVGPITRLLLAYDLAQTTRDPSDVLRALATGHYPALGTLPATEPSAGPEAAAEQLIRFGVATGRRKLARAG
jgi:anaerobic magnesium-protoporphyrin IX monomethyl ester cyclase